MLNDITVNKAELLEILYNNRSKHREVFLAALDGWYKERIEYLDKLKMRLEQRRSPNQVIDLRVPIDHSADYDTAIKMVEMHTGDTIGPLDQHTFSQYVMDNWSWMGDFRKFSATNARGTAGSVYGRAWLDEADDD